MGRKIFETVRLNNLTMKNRLIRSATWEGLSDFDGSISDEAYEIYSEVAHGGVGTVIVGFTDISDDDHYIHGAMRLSRDELIPQYRKLTDIIHAEGCAVISQLAMGAYYRKLPNGLVKQVEPDQMTQDEIRNVIEMFIQSAKRAGKAGCDGVQIHAAHFFFLSRFISPRVNHRTDIYGGDTVRRSRILKEILSGIKSKCPGLHISVKINSSDFTLGGLEEDESLEICRLLAENGIDSIEVSGNGTSVEGIRPHVNEAYFLDFAARLAESVNVSVILVGGLRSIQTMQEILDNTKIELLSLSRPLLREPDLPEKFRKGESSESKCISCNACYGSHAHRCVFVDFR
ncbi:MAG: NADH:flavin oxidoreductase [Synergistaceae bacterium]|nr:NADH:flavin oxidoreductase [Synergistaceae bacterium]MBQ6419342.1 NADH:flavin oxidoreductase [Synergistaceae bacterium]MBQ6664185.1 NADH:flavin oxidoreductase [Synergistaceae bacterium]MBQ6980819.1 NADH:flavin oxidoreductase [Synergistaceae bacterium]MBR0247798.1 NADH:flavin oxidoreductase [Synergistaceae bacterium]